MPIVVLFYPYHIIPQKHDSALSKERGANRSGKILLFTLSAGLNLPERNGILHTTSSIKIMLQGIGVYRISGETIWCGDFHGQWCEAPASLPLNLAALSICGHDFFPVQFGGYLSGGSMGSPGHTTETVVSCSAAGEPFSAAFHLMGQRRFRIEGLPALASSGNRMVSAFRCGLGQRGAALPSNVCPGRRT